MPAERALAKGVKVSIGKFLSSNIETIASPTKPVAPTTATLNFFITLMVNWDG
jgi:hypothetical protein